MITLPVEARDVAHRADYSKQKRTDTKPDTGSDPAFGNDPTLYFIDMLSEMGYSKEKIKQILKEGV